MKLISTIIILFSSIPKYANGQEKLLFFQTNWGNQLSWDAFCESTKASGYDGIEVWLPVDKNDQESLRSALKKHNLLVAFLNGTDKTVHFQESLKAYTDNLKLLLAWKPVYINCHTGSDFYTMAQNKAFIDAAILLSTSEKIPIYHETHRGRFSYNLPDTKRYLQAIPDLKLNLDISHWMVVHESLLKDNDADLIQILDRSYHIHARVGHEEAPQVNDPEAPEWASALERHLDIWEQLIRQKWKEGKDTFTVTTEFGPPNYLPTLPYTQMPVSDQWRANVFIMNALKKRLGIE